MTRADLSPFDTEGRRDGRQALVEELEDHPGSRGGSRSDRSADGYGRGTGLRHRRRTSANKTAEPEEAEEPEEPAVETTSACDQAFAAAAQVDEMQDTIDDMLPAVRACDSVEEWKAASAAYPDALDGADAETVLANMCASRDEINDAPLCESRRGPGLTPRKLARQACRALEAGQAESKVVQELAATTTDEDVDLVETLTEIERQCAELLN